MARMIPSTVPPETKSDGEKSIFLNLQNDPATKDWVVIHSLDIAKHVSQISGEADFIVVVPELGALCIEVKAHRSISRTGGEWFYGSDPKPDLRGPFKQADRAMRSICNYLFSKAPELQAVPFFSIAAFTHIVFEDSSPEWHPWQFIDKRRIERDGLSACIVKCLSASRKHLEETKSAKWFVEKDKKPSHAEVKRIADLLRPEFEYYESPKSRKKTSLDEIKNYTEEQFEALDLNDLNERTAFIGPAGTGKTLLAIETARREAAMGNNVLFLCYNKMLGHFLHDELTSAERIRCTHIDSFMLQATGVKIEETQNFWNEQLPKHLTQAAQQGKIPQYDVLVLDEAQDFMTYAYIEALNSLMRKGLSGSRIRMFGDFWAQSVHQSDFSLEEMKKAYIPDLPIYPLKKNCRNTPRVASLAAKFVEDSIKYGSILRQDDGIQPRVIFYKNSEEQIDLLLKIISEYKANHIPLDEIAVLSARASNGAYEQLNKVFSGSSKTPDRLDNGLICTTIRRFKGLERYGVIVTDVEDNAQYKLPELLYIACTRSVGRLTIFAHEQMKTSTLFNKGVTNAAA